MVDLTNPVETVVSILKNSSTGIGTTGYEITDDNASGLTIADGEILVAFTMSKEELKSAFGGSQDYDVIFTVKSGEIEDEWIGLSSKVLKAPIIITIHVIDKWSAVATKYITAPLVLYKAVNALRKFIKAKTDAPGGTINIWKSTSWKNEEDTSVKPTMYKCIVTTEAWMYYNPSDCPTGGERILNYGFETGDATSYDNNDAEIVSTDPHSGTYCAKCDAEDDNIGQEDLDIAVACIDTCTVWYKCSSSPAGECQILVIYDDESETTISDLAATTWTEVDIKAQLTAGKTVSSIYAGQISGAGSTVLIDDISLRSIG